LHFTWQIYTRKFAYIKKIIFDSFLVILDKKISSSILAACIKILCKYLSTSFQHRFKWS